MNVCPFCNYDEGWVRESSLNPNKYTVICKVCGAIGPESTTREGAEDKWNGTLKDLDAQQIRLSENVGAPMTTLTNTPGMGNAQPASVAAMTGSQQMSSSCIGSGDKWDNGGKKKKNKKRKTKKFYPSLEEESINPYDKIGVYMAKKMKVPVYFKKGKNQSVKQK